MKPLCIDVYCGLGGWTEGFLAEGWQVIGFDIEQHVYGDHRYPGELVIQDALTLHGGQFKDADCIVCSPPCQKYSYMAMPWSRSKAMAAEIRADTTGAKLEELNRLFNNCFRIQREAIEAAGRHIPMVVENVRGAQPWVGRSRWNFGSFHLFGDVPALMPATLRARKQDREVLQRDGHNVILPQVVYREDIKNAGGSWFNIVHNTTSGVGQNPDGRKLAGFRFDGSGRSFQSASVEHTGVKAPGMNWSDLTKGPGQDFTRIAGRHAAATAEGRKGAGAGAEWFDANLCRLPSKSPRRKAASAMIAKIPFALSSWIARCFLPRESEAA